MTPQEFLDKVYPYIKRYAANLHERVDLRISALGSYGVDTSSFTKSIEEDLFHLAAKVASGPIVDSHSGTVRAESERGITWEMVLTLKTLFELEVIRQASEIHTGRGKMQDTQYAFCKQVVREYFDMVKGNPDELFLTQAHLVQSVNVCNARLAEKSCPKSPDGMHAIRKGPWYPDNPRGETLEQWKADFKLADQLCLHCGAAIW